MSRKKWWLAGLAVPVLVIGYWLGSPLFLNKTVNEAAPPLTAPVATGATGATEAVVSPAPPSHTGSFSDGDDRHHAKGTVQTYASEGTLYLRFEEFQVTNGPDLYVYLVEPGQKTGTGIEVGELKGNIGNQNYVVPAGVDLQRHRQVIIWCKAFDENFGIAELTRR